MAPVWMFVSGLAKQWWENRQKRNDHQMRVEEAITENKIRLAQSTESHNAAWEMAQIAGADKNLRRLSFAVWSTPAIWAMFDPESIKESFSAALQALPEWYVYGYLAMTGAIWGIAEMRSMGLLRKAP